MKKVDYKKGLKHLYKPSSKKVVIVDVSAMNFLMIDGSGNPNTAQSYIEAVEALYAVAYTLKFKIKKTREIDYGVMPLEGLWWADDMSTFTTARNKDTWHWTMMIMQPESVTEELFKEAHTEVEKKKNPAALSKLGFGTYHEGLSAHIMHLGSYDDEGPTIAKLHSFISENGYKPRGKHHEIYLGDPRKTASEKLKTVLKQPIER
jgi:hypothetical protein